MSTLKVGGIRGVSASSDAITVANDGSCTANITNNLSNRNLVINGAMQVAQRGTSSTVAEGYGSVDRFKSNNANNDEAPTQSQVDIAAGTTPYTLGFRKAFRMTNGNQTGGAGSNDRVCIIYNFEGQDIANSGWNYVSDSSFVTISFWVKSSVAQNFFVQLRARDGTEQGFTFETGSLSADTWTKVTKTVPGNSNLQFDNDNTAGLLMEWNIFRGTDKTGSMSLDTWAAFNGSVRTPDQTSTWYTTNDATFEITGVQLEVGSVATDFEHRSFAQELALCQRYCQKNIVIQAVAATTTSLNMRTPLFCEMRATPTVSKIAADGSANLTFVFGDMVSVSDNSTSTPSIISYSGNEVSVAMALSGFDNLTQYRTYRHEPQSTLQAICLFSAEL